MKTPNRISRIRRTDTGEFYRGGARGGWDHTGASYATPAACKCAWRHYVRYSQWIREGPPPVEIVVLEVSEIPIETHPLAP